MPTSIYRGTAPQAEEFVVAYLSQWFSNVRTEMPNDPPFPFHLVNRISGGDDMVSDYATVSIHSFDRTRIGAADAADAVHAKMKLSPRKSL
jgi:hypothetical protein